MEPIKQVRIERTYHASIETVWNAWTDAEQLKKWWGPDNVSIPECTVDLRIGGIFYIVMEAGEAMGPLKGLRWPMKASYTTIEPNAQLSYTAQAWTEGESEGDTLIDQTTEVSFADENGKTKVTVVAAIYKTGPKAGMAVQGMEYGFNQQMDKLTGFLKA